MTEETLADGNSATSSTAGGVEIPEEGQPRSGEVGPQFHPAPPDARRCGAVDRQRRQPDIQPEVLGSWIRTEPAVFESLGRVERGSGIAQLERSGAGVAREVLTPPQPAEAIGSAEAREALEQEPPQCPECLSRDVKSSGGRAAILAFLGWFSGAHSHAHRRWQCRNCGYDWRV